MVQHFDEKLADQAEKMLATMYDAKGIGLAGTQVDFHQRLIVIDVSENRDSPIKLVNPEIKLIGETVSNEEGCLSIPGVYDSVKRSDRINVTAQARALGFRNGGRRPSGDLHTAWVRPFGGIYLLTIFQAWKRINEQLKKNTWVIELESWK